VWTNNDRLAAAGPSVNPDRWQVMFEELITRISPRFTRVEPRRRVRALLLGLLSDLPNKNCWTVSEHAGDETPDGMQHLLRKAVWNDEDIQSDLRDYVVEHLGDAGAVLVVDETGDLKKGNHTVGVQRQYTGTAGRIENAQVAVFLTYATDTGHAFLDRALYLPKSWTEDPDRSAAAGIPSGTVFATKPALATTMIGRALDAGVTAAWVAGDEVYGADPGLRADLETRGVGYVLAIGCDRRVDTPAGTLRADEVAAGLPKHVWQRLSAGAGAKGHRFYDWAWIDIDADHGHRWLLIRRSRSTGELAYYRCYAPHAGSVTCLGDGRWSAVDGRGVLPDRERSHRSGSAPSSPMDVVASVDDPGDACSRVPRSAHSDRTNRATRHRGMDRVDLQRNPPPLHRGHPPTGSRSRTQIPVLTMAATPPVPLPAMPLPAAIHPRTMTTTN
jgi:SRSO17 transposase